MTVRRLNDIVHASPARVAKVVSLWLVLLLTLPIAYLLRIPAVPYLWISRFRYNRERSLNDTCYEIFDHADKVRDREEMERLLEEGDDAL